MKQLSRNCQQSIRRKFAEESEESIRQRLRKEQDPFDLEKIKNIYKRKGSHPPKIQEVINLINDGIGKWDDLYWETDEAFIAESLNRERGRLEEQLDNATEDESIQIQERLDDIEWEHDKNDEKWNSYRDQVRDDAETAEKEAISARELLEEYAYEDALNFLEHANTLEMQYGDSPVWGEPFRRLRDFLDDQYENFAEESEEKLERDAKMGDELAKLKLLQNKGRLTSHKWVKLHEDLDFANKEEKRLRKILNDHPNEINSINYDYARKKLEDLKEEIQDLHKQQNFAEAKKPRRMLQTIVVSKTIAKDENEAKDIAQKHGVTDDLIETDSSWRFRQRNASEFDPDSFKTKKEKGVALVYADLLDSGEEFDEEEYLDFDFPEDEVVKETVGYKDKTQVTEKPPEKIRARKASAYELEQAKKLGNKKKSEIALKGKKAEIEKKVSGKKKGSAKDIQLSYNQETKRFEAPKGLPQYVEARGETYEYDGRKWSAPSGNFMMPHALASSLINNESQPIGDDMIKVSSDKLQFAESKHKSKEKEILQKIVKEKDPLKVNELFRKLEEVEFGGVSFAEQRSESYESAQNFLKRQRELEKDIIDLRWDLKALYHEARNTPVEKGLDANYELIDKIADAEKALANAKEELKSFNKGERKFAEDLVITQIEEPVAQKNLSRAKKAELKLKKKELNENNDEDKKYRNIVSIGEAESEKFDEQLNYTESLPDEVITNENGNIVMYKFNTEENGYQIKVIISPSGDSIPIEEDEEAIFSIDMLVDPQPVPGTKYIEGSEEFGEEEYVVAASSLKVGDLFSPYYISSTRHQQPILRVESIFKNGRIQAKDIKVKSDLTSEGIWSFSPKSKVVLKNDSQQDFGLLSLIEAISPANAYMKYVMGPMSDMVGAHPDSDWEKEMYPNEYDTFAEESEEQLERKLARDPSDEDARRNLLKLRNRKSGDIERLKSLKKEYDSLLDRTDHKLSGSEEEQNEQWEELLRVTHRMAEIKKEVYKLRNKIGLENYFYTYNNGEVWSRSNEINNSSDFLQGLENFSERDDLPDEETWRLTLEDYDRDFNDLMSKPGKGTQVRNLKEKLRDYLIEKEIPIYEILQKYPNIREAFLLPVKEYPVMKSSKFSEEERLQKEWDMTQDPLVRAKLDALKRRSNSTQDVLQEKFISIVTQLVPIDKQIKDYETQGFYGFNTRDFPPRSEQRKINAKVMKLIDRSSDLHSSLKETVSDLNKIREDEGMEPLSIDLIHKEILDGVLHKFSEVASHLKEVALDEIQDSKEEEKKNRTLFKYYLNEFIDEKESEGLKPIQIDVALTKALGSSLYESRENEINEVYSTRFPMGLKE